uniref:Uncharacterized protein n=1 Tax=Anopheles arabiensis TaxID=7173 RepID=A0A182IHJ9_ANOAR
MGAYGCLLSELVASVT